MRVPRSLTRLVVGLAGTQLGLRLAPGTTRALGPVDVTADVALTPQGGVRVDVPPLGTAWLGTHRGPLQLRATATNVEPERAAGLLRMPSDKDDAQGVRAQLDTVLASVARDARGLAAAASLRAGLAGLAGAAGLAAVTLRRPRDVAAATAASAASLAAAAALAAATADREAWRDPRLTGLLTRAPLLVGDLQQAPTRIGVYRDQLADLIRTATGVQRRVAALPGPPPGDAIRLVHVSDIHLSPMAFPLAKALVDEYRADAVIDTGDLVDWGTPAENAFAGQIPGLGVPYVYVKGNHDSTGIAAAVGRQPNAVVLDSAETAVDVAGLRFVGMPDPRFTPDKTTGDDRAHHRVSEAAEAFAGRFRAGGARADIALVHSPTAGRALEGLVPLVLAGDTHRRDARRYGDTTVLTQGSSGGAGLRGVQQDPPTPFSLSVLYVDRTTRRLWGADEVTLGGLGRTDVSVVRRTAADLLGEG
ncbi:MAG TPA: metallophosphoesterase [Jatrophihabitans sp.]|jgi:predicted MPP superfamily phosphohydrolase|uniref:metallophosphoesterase family protein n=1 Tax=Jatrophihabitans sp. TaxID=1932789 RepID=UPI002DFE52A1|nr:metallophosphoesterase [Jatrophihabitans sp.]